MSAASRWEWLDFDDAESKQVRDFLSQDAEGEGIDPLRIGASVRDRIAEQLFPGTSTQYTRLRYVFLVPALLRKQGATIGNLKQSQTALNEALDKANLDETGVIGRRTRGRDFVHLYWTAVRTWKLLTPVTADLRDVTVPNGLAALQSKTVADEEGNPLLEHRVQWNPTVVRLADQFWADQKTKGWPSVHCRKAEVNFILCQWLDLSNKPPLAAIAFQLRNGCPQSGAEYPWDVDVGGATAARDQLDHAKAVSLICWSAQLAYNFALLKEAKRMDANGVAATWKLRSRDLATTEEQIEIAFDKWQAAFALEKSTLGPWTSPSYWEPLGSPVSRSFLASTAKLLATGKTDLKSGLWSAWVKEREKVNNPAPKLSNPNHLVTWSGTPEMAQRWDFRWKASVRRFVKDAENPHG